MAAPVLHIEITLSPTAVASEVVAKLMSPPNQAPTSGVAKLAAYLEGMASFLPAGGVAMFVDDGGGVKASGTVTFAGLPATGNTVTIGGETFTWRTLANSALPNEITIGASATACAAALAVAVNKSAIAQGLVIATSVAAVTTLTARVPGLNGNGITLARVGGNMTVSGATLASGTASTGIAGGAYFKAGV